MAYIYCTNKGINSFAVELRGLDGTWDKGNRTVYWYCVVAQSGVEAWDAVYTDDDYNNYSTIESTNGVACNIKTGGACILGNLAQNTTYHVKALVWGDVQDEMLAELYGTVTTNKASSETTGPGYPTLESITERDGYLTIDYTVDLTTAYTLSQLLIEVCDANDKVKTETSITSPGSRGTWTSTKRLDAGRYYIYITAKYKEYPYTRLESGPYVFTVEEPLTPTIELWSWELGSGSNRDLAYQALIGKKETTHLSHLVWNDFIDKILEFLNYTGTAQTSIGSSVYGYDAEASYGELLNSAKMSVSDRYMTAKRFNIVRYCIGSSANATFDDGNNSIATHQANTGSWDMKKGEPVIGQYFLDLAAYANKIIC